MGIYSWWLSCLFVSFVCHSRREGGKKECIWQRQLGKCLVNSLFMSSCRYTKIKKPKNKWDICQTHPIHVEPLNFHPQKVISFIFCYIPNPQTKDRHNFFGFSLPPKIAYNDTFFKDFPYSCSANTQRGVNVLIYWWCYLLRIYWCMHVYILINLYDTESFYIICPCVDWLQM